MAQLGHDVSDERDKPPANPPDYESALIELRLAARIGNNLAERPVVEPLDRYREGKEYQELHPE